MDSASSSASFIVGASLYIRIIGSVFDLRRWTQLVGKSILTPVYIGYLLAGIFLLDSLENRIDVDVGE